MTCLLEQEEGTRGGGRERRGPKKDNRIRRRRKSPPPLASFLSLSAIDYRQKNHAHGSPEYRPKKQQQLYQNLQNIVILASVFFYKSANVSTAALLPAIEPLIGETNRLSSLRAQIVFYDFFQEDSAIIHGQRGV